MTIEMIKKATLNKVAFFVESFGSLPKIMNYPSRFNPVKVLHPVLPIKNQYFFPRWSHIVQQQVYLTNSILLLRDSLNESLHPNDTGT